MKCPACDRELAEQTAGSITVDVCRGVCGGIWFDRFEFDKVDEAHEGAGEALLDIERDPNLQVDHEKRRNCPKCDGVVMRRFFHSKKQKVDVDECPSCAGMWLDHGELGAIRTQFANEEQREAAARAYFDDLFGDELRTRAVDRKENVAQARQVARMMRFVCPSNYIPGKQDWGAF